MKNRANNPVSGRIYRLNDVYIRLRFNGKACSMYTEIILYLKNWIIKTKSGRGMCQILDRSLFYGNEGEGKYMHGALQS